MVSKVLVLGCFGILGVVFWFCFVLVLARNYMQIFLCRLLSEVLLWVCVS